MLPLVLFDGVDGADVRMIQRRSGARFALESLERQRVLRQVGRQELQRHLAAELGVFRLIDDTHAAATDSAKHSVMGNRLPYRRVCFVHVLGSSALARGANRAMRLGG